MTCCNMHLPAWQGRFPSGKFVALSVFLRHHPPCSRTHTPAFCMPSQTPSLHPRTRPSFCMSLRTSAHTGVAIRVPAGKLGKLALLQANPQHLSYSPEVLLSVAPCRREYGLSRRSAPRNDMQKIGACPRLPVGTAGKRSFCAVRPWWYGILPLCGASSDWDLLLQQVPGTASPASPACPG